MLLNEKNKQLGINGRYRDSIDCRQSILRQQKRRNFPTISSAEICNIRIKTCRLTSRRRLVSTCGRTRPDMRFRSRRTQRTGERSPARFLSARTACGHSACRKTQLTVECHVRRSCGLPCRIARIGSQIAINNKLY